MITIRQALPDDLPHCAAITATYTTRFAWQMAREGKVQIERQAEGDARLSFHLQQVRLPKTRMLRLPSASIPLETRWHRYDARLVALWDEVLCGYLMLHVPGDQQQAMIARLLVDEPARGKGVGAALVQAAGEWAIRSGAFALLAHAPLRNVAGITFYQQRGFRISGVSEQFYHTREDALLLGHMLS